MKTPASTYWPAAGIFALIASIWLIQWALPWQILGLNSSATALMVSLFILIPAVSIPLRRQFLVRQRDRKILRKVKPKDKLDAGGDGELQALFYKQLEALRHAGTNFEHLPILVITGTSAEHVRNVIANSKLRPATSAPLKPIKGVVGSLGYHWWVTRDALVVDLSPAYAEADNSVARTIDFNRVMAFLGLMRSQPVTALIGVVGMEDLNSLEHPETRVKILRLRSHFSSVMTGVQTTLPCYFIVDGIDHIEGFAPYYAHVADPSKALGCVSLDGLAPSNASSYLHMIAKLYEFLPNGLAACVSKEDKQRVCKFPSALVGLGQPIDSVTYELLAGHPELILKGLYYVASDEYPLAANALQSILRQVAYKKPVALVGARGLRRLGTMSIAITLGAWIAGVLYAYHHYTTPLSHVSGEIRKYETGKYTRSPSIHVLPDVITHLETIRTLSGLANRNTEIKYLPDFPLRARIHSLLRSLYVQEVNRVLPGALVAAVEKMINSAEYKREEAFVVLEVYLGLTRFNEEDRKIVDVFLKEIYSRYNAKMQIAFLSHYRVLRADAMRQVKVNQVIANELRATIDDALITKMVLRTINEHLDKESAAKQVVLLKALLPHSLQPYLINPDADSVPFRYTLEGAQQYSVLLETALTEYQKRSWALTARGGLSDVRIHAMRKQILEQYHALYAAHWIKFIDGIRIVPLQNNKAATVFLRTIKQHPEFFSAVCDIALLHLAEIKKSNMIDTYHYVNDVRSETKISEVATNLLDAITQNNKSDLVKQLNALKVAKITNKQPLRFLNATAHILRASLFDDERQILAHRWNDSVRPLCVKVTEMYPFDPKSKKSSSLKKFEELLGPQGTLEQYARNNLSTYVTKEFTWNDKGRALQIDSSVLDTITRARNLRRLLFTKNHVLLYYELAPKLLDTRSDQFTLTVGNKTLKYRHGAQLSETVPWTAAVRPIQFIFSKTGAQSTQGNIPQDDWSFPRLVEAAQDGQRSMVFRAGDYVAEYSARLVGLKAYNDAKKIFPLFKCQAIK